MQPSVEKCTLVPVYRVVWDLPKETRMSLGREIVFENVEHLLKPQDFELWKHYVSEDARKKLAAVRFALVHRFSSFEHVGAEEQKSIDLLYRTFICLRLIKPTKSNWSNIQFKNTPSGIDVFSFTHPTEEMAATPEAEAFNEIDLDDIHRLNRLLDVFLGTVDDGPINVRRAIRHFELGYSEVREPALQFVTWMMALEQFYSSGDDPAPRGPLLTEKLSEHLDLDEDIYANSQFRELFPHSPAVTARQALPDLFAMRNRFVHGQWIPQEWLQPFRTHTLYEKTSYADVLREIASWLVRKSIVKYLEVETSKKG